jgi:uncharacterized protein (DUF927 family)
MYNSYFNRQETVSSAAIAAPQQFNSDAHQLTISLFKNVRDNDPKERTLAWSAFCNTYFAKHQALKIKENGAAWSPACYPTGVTRQKDKVETVSCAVFDVEHHCRFDELLDKLVGYAYVAHSSYRHSAEDPRYRIVLPLIKPVAADAWEATWDRLNHWLGGINDPQTKNADRIYFLPSMPADAKGHFIEIGEGKPLDIEELPELPAEFVAKVSASTAKTYSKVKIEGIEEAPPDPLNPAIGLVRVVERCAFMQWASGPDNQNDVSNPHWMAMTSNACRFEESDAWIHEASCQYDGYDEAKTDGLIARCRDFPAPITCKTIQENGFKGCPAGGCKKQSGETTKAPAGIWLGDNGNPTNQAEVIESASDSADDEKHFGCFVLNPNGVFKIRFKDGEEFRTKVASYIEITAQTRDSNQTNWGFLITVKDPDQNFHEWAMPQEMLPSPKVWKAELLKMGAVIYQTGQQDLLYEYFIEATPSTRALCVMQPGWHNQVFALPNQVIGETTTERVVLQTNDLTGADVFRPNGTLTQWQENVGVSCIGNSRLVFSVCAALAGPTLHLLGEENGGFHIVGGSSIGKTTAVEVAASVWGNRTKFVRNWRTTGNAIESVASRHNDTLLILDEISQVSPFEAGEIAYMLGNGRGKSRATVSGSVRTNAQWRLVYLSTGEQSLADHMQNAGKRTMAGQEVRLVNLPADAGTGLGLFENIHASPSAQQFATELKRTTAEYYGEAGPAFVSELADAEQQVELLDAIRRDSQTFVNGFVPVGSCGQVLRVGKRFALLAAVGELATRLGILPWPEGEAIAACRTCFHAWIDGRGGVENQEADQAIAQVRRFLETHGESRFTAWDEMRNSYEGYDSRCRTINRAGFRKVTDDDRTEFYVLPEIFKTEICAGLNPKEVTKALRDSGFLVVGSDGKSIKQERLPGVGSVKVYRIKPDILGEAG